MKRGCAIGAAVLVVEDEPPIRSLLKEGLATEGYAVTTVPNAHEALAVLEHDQADVVLLDLMLPGMSGLELARIIHERWPSYIIAMSASSRLLARADRDPSVNVAVSKPFDWDQLLEDLQHRPHCNGH